MTVTKATIVSSARKYAKDLRSGAVKPKFDGSFAFAEGRVGCAFGQILSRAGFRPRHVEVSGNDEALCLALTGVDNSVLDDIKALTKVNGLSQRLMESANEVADVYGSYTTYVDDEGSEELKDATEALAVAVEEFADDLERSPFNHEIKRKILRSAKAFKKTDTGELSW